MNKTEFKRQRDEEREKLLKRIVSSFTVKNPVAIHQFGSGTKGFKDEFSDIDIWITFPDNEIKKILPKLPTVFKTIAPVLVRHYSKSWSPVGGSANSIIHDTDAGPIIVDYYISKYSETIIPSDAKLLYGDDTLIKGKWRLNKEVNKQIHDTHTIKKDINLMLNLLFISTKGIVRKWESDEFIETLKTVHRNFRKRYGNSIKRRQITLTYRSNYRLLSDLYPLARGPQKRAIRKIRRYSRQVEELY